MKIADERALKNLSESPYVCISKLFLQPKKQFYLKNASFKIYFPTDQNNRIYLFKLSFIVFYKYKLTCESYSMYILIFICSIYTWSCFNSMSSIKQVRWQVRFTFSYKSIENKERLPISLKKHSRLLWNIFTFVIIIKVSQVVSRLKVNQDSFLSQGINQNGRGRDILHIFFQNIIQFFKYLCPLRNIFTFYHYKGISNSFVVL